MNQNSPSPVRELTLIDLAAPLAAALVAASGTAREGDTSLQMSLHIDEISGTSSDGLTRRSTAIIAILDAIQNPKSAIAIPSRGRSKSWWIVAGMIVALLAIAWTARGDSPAEASASSMEVMPVQDGIVLTRDTQVDPSVRYLLTNHDHHACAISDYLGHFAVPSTWKRETQLQIYAICAGKEVYLQDAIVSMTGDQIDPIRLRYDLDEIRGNLIHHGWRRLPPLVRWAVTVTSAGLMVSLVLTTIEVTWRRRHHLRSLLRGESITR